MAVALDTNIMWPLLVGVQPAAAILADLLQAHNTRESLVVCAPVYAELLAGSGASLGALDAALAHVGIAVDDVIPLALWQEAGLAYRAYAQRRIDAGETWPRRILADFIIGVHALHRATALITLNRTDFARIFPSLPLIVPDISVPATPEIDS